MNPQQIANAIQELLALASIPASRPNTERLTHIHNFLDGIQAGKLVVGSPVQESVPTVEPAK